MTTILIKDILSTDIRSRSNGEKVRKAIQGIKNVTLNFTEVEFISRSFADELYNIVTKIDAQITGMQEEVQKMYTIVVNSRQKERIRTSDSDEIIYLETAEEVSKFFL